MAERLSRRDFLKCLGFLTLTSVSRGLKWPETAETVPLNLAHFFLETKFWVKDKERINFLSEFYRLGGPPLLGYPISRIFEDKGFLNQAFQRGILQWRPDFRLPQAVLTNLLDELHQKGKDDWLEQFKGIPRHFAGDDGSGGDFNKAREIRWGWLTEEGIKAAYFSNPNPSQIPDYFWDPVAFYGLPTSKPEKHGPFVAQRFQKVVFQKWIENVPAMPAPGSVVKVLVGDLAKEAGLIPLPALQKEESPFKKEINSPPVIYSGDRTKSLVSLTIDDAWSPSLVAQALEAARNFGVKMTLFPVGRVIASQPTLWRQAVGEGHEIGNHTFTHRKLTSLSDEEIIWDIQESQNVLDKVLGHHYPMRLLRPPGGDGGYGGGNSRLVGLAQSLGYSLAMWSASSGGAASAEEVANRVLSSVKNGEIILFHFNPNDIGALPTIINWLKNNNLQPVTLSELFA